MVHRIRHSGARLHSCVVVVSHHIRYRVTDRFAPGLRAHHVASRLRIRDCVFPYRGFGGFTDRGRVAIRDVAGSLCALRSTAWPAEEPTKLSHLLGLPIGHLGI